VFVYQGGPCSLHGLFIKDSNTSTSSSNTPFFLPFAFVAMASAWPAHIDFLKVTY
jgi:hypothetical protein